MLRTLFIGQLMSVQLNRDAKWCRRSDSGFLGALWDGDLEGGAGDVVVAPLDHQDVVAPLLQQVAYVVLQVAHVFDQDLLTGDQRTVDTHQEHVLTWEEEGTITSKVSENQCCLKCLRDIPVLFSQYNFTQNQPKCVCSIEYRKLLAGSDCHWQSLPLVGYKLKFVAFSMPECKYFILLFSVLVCVMLALTSKYI